MARKNTLYFVVILIGILLITDVILTNRNNEIIKANKQLQAETARIDLYYDHIGKLLIQAFDLGLRGYAIVADENIARPMNHALEWKDSIFNQVEKPLAQWNYDLTEFHTLKDSVDAYAVYCFSLKKLLTEGNRDEFTRLFKKDKGGTLWWQYELCEKDINEFTSHIHQEAQIKYDDALARNHTLQIILFLICFPTLLYTAYRTQTSFLLSEKLRITVDEKNKLLTEQNAMLEREVAVRTAELAAQNEEIITQSEELATQRDTLFLQNTKLLDAQLVIEAQNRNIQHKNQELEDEVKHRTQELQNTNHELIDHNNQLEQFAFISAHNLRAPLARILGLANLMQLTGDDEEKKLLLTNIVSSSQDLDQVIKDLSTILEIRKHTGAMTEVDIVVSLTRVQKSLAREIEETHAIIRSDLGKTKTIHAVSPYVESVLYNLISNAIKFRDPERTPEIIIRTSETEGYFILTISDNGLGIDLNRFRKEVFNLYKRFHVHVEGKGLGLYLVRTQMAALGGKVEIESEPGEGTVFRLYFSR